MSTAHNNTCLVFFFILSDTVVGVVGLGFLMNWLYTTTLPILLFSLFWKNNLNNKIMFSFLITLTILINALVFVLNVAVSYEDLLTASILVTLFVSSYIVLLYLPKQPLKPALFKVTLILLTYPLTYVFLTTNSLFTQLLVFESFLLLTGLMLLVSGKTDQMRSAITELLVMALFGSAVILIGFFTTQNYSLLNQPLNHQLMFFSSQLPNFFLILGFGVKNPLWPFYNWLLKAHVEATTEVSIFLSGFLIKLGFYGALVTLTRASFSFELLVFKTLSLLGVFEMSLRLISEIDLKKIVATLTVLEMNWSLLMVLTKKTSLITLAILLILVHAFLTALEFLIVEFIFTRFSTRNIFLIGGLAEKTPLLWLFSFSTYLFMVGFPPTPLFWVKILFLVEFLHYSKTLTFAFSALFYLTIPVTLMRTFSTVWFGRPHDNQVYRDMTWGDLHITLILTTTLLALPFLLVVLWN